MRVLMLMVFVAVMVVMMMIISAVVMMVFVVFAAVWSGGQAPLQVSHYQFFGRGVGNPSPDGNAIKGEVGQGTPTDPAGDDDLNPLLTQPPGECPGLVFGRRNSLGAEDGLARWIRLHERKLASAAKMVVEPIGFNGNSYFHDFKLAGWQGPAVRVCSREAQLALPKAGSPNRNRWCPVRPVMRYQCAGFRGLRVPEFDGPDAGPGLSMLLFIG
jgi:hypothetical protein